MISELDIYGAANLVIKRYGADAVIERGAQSIACSKWAISKAATYGGVSAARSRCCRRRPMEFGIERVATAGVEVAPSQQKPTTNSYR
jgi:hypothetical protein